MSFPETTDLEAPAGYRLGDPIALEDLLALPPDGRRYDRDEQGRLTLVAPEDAGGHRSPIGELTLWLARRLDAPWFPLSEPEIALPRLVTLRGAEVPPSRLGRRIIQPDVAVFDRRPSIVPGNPAGTREGWTVFEPEGLRLVVEVLSRGTWRDDVGRGAADRVDRWRSYLLSGVPEYWLLNVNVDAAPLPPGSGLFLSAAADAWRPLPVDDLRSLPGEVHGLAPVAAGRVAARSIPGLELDVEAFFARLAR